MPLAALVGALIGGTLLEAIGRKTTIVCTAVPLIVAGLLVAFAQDVYTIYAGRGITGFCIGILSFSAPVYLAETIHPKIRGTLGLLPTSLGNVGIMICYILGFWLDWSQLSLAGAIMPLPFLILMCLVPESPRYLLAKEKEAKARSALQWLRGQNIDISHELTDMEKAIVLAKNQGFKAKEWFQRAYVKPLVVSLGLMFAQQFSGYNAVLFYSVSIFKDAGSSIDANLSTIILGVVNIIATLFSNFFIDRLGRKILLYISSIGMIISLAIFGAFFYLKVSCIWPFQFCQKQIDTSFQDIEHEVPGWIPLVALMVYLASFSIGFGPVPWLMMAEIFPSRIRGPAASLVTTFNWTCVFVVTNTFMNLQKAITPYGVFWLFALILLAFIFFIIFYVPETQGLSLEKIERSFTGITGMTQAITHVNESFQPEPSQIKV